MHISTRGVHTMSRITLCPSLLALSACLALGALVLPSAAPPVVHASTTYAWAGKGSDWTWGNTQNWQPNGTPQAGDSAVIAPSPTSQGPAVTGAPTGLSLQDLTLGPHSSLDGGSLTVTGSFTWTGNGTLN